MGQMFILWGALHGVSVNVAGNGSLLEQMSEAWWKGESTIIHKIFAKNCSFHVELEDAGKVSFLFLSRFLLESAKFLLWEGDWALDLVLNFEVFRTSSNFLSLNVV